VQPLTWIKEAASNWANQRLGPDLVDKLRSVTTRQNEYGYDPFGFHRDGARVAAAIGQLFYRNYFRVQTFGIENVPDGPCLLVANHSGQLPWDGVTVACSLLFDRDPPRVVRAMVERYIQRLPFFSYLFARCGQILGTPENCRRLLDSGEIILVFPEGVRGIAKPITKRYQLQEFGLGFMRLAIETRAPVVPVAVIGAEEHAPAFNLAPVAQLLHMPSFPVMPTPPFLPILPYPTRHRVYFGEPLRFTGDPDDDDNEVALQVKQVRMTLQSMLNVGLKERKHVFW
jgi:1-acyl-sn-glycerol-3-phosphate acyltransferase